MGYIAVPEFFNTSVGKRRKERKRQKSTGHVVPAPGSEARQTRRESMRDAKGRSARLSLPLLDDTDDLNRMSPRTRSISGRRKERQAERPPERVWPVGKIWVSWRWVSGIMSGVLLLLMIGFLTLDAFYINSVAVGGVNYLSREEVFRFADISQKHIFWVDEQEVKERLEANNNIASAEVKVGWPPDMVQIVVRERDPAIIWEQGDNRVWVDVNGLVMFQREDRSDLLRVVYDPAEPIPPETLGASSRIDTEIVHGALLLKSRMPHIDVLLYNPRKGLGWREPRGWMVWFGTGSNMDMKSRVYDAIVSQNFNAVQFGEIDVSDPDYPTYTVLFEKNE